MLHLIQFLNICHIKPQFHFICLKNKLFQKKNKTSFCKFSETIQSVTCPFSKPKNSVQ